MGYRGFGIAEVCRDGKQTQVVNKPPRRFLAAFGIKRYDAAAQTALLTHRQGITRMGIQTGMQNPLNRFLFVQPFCNSQSRFAMRRILGGIIAGNENLLRERIFPFLRCGGPAISPFNAWVAAKGLETLPLRMRAHSESALTIAKWLHKQKPVERVLHTGLDSHPGYALAMRQQSGLGGGIISFYAKGGKEAAWRFIDNLRLFSITANFGDAKSTVSHPATTTHAKVEESLREKLGIRDNLVRLSIGLEDANDLQTDLATALTKI